MSDFWRRLVAALLLLIGFMASAQSQPSLTYLGRVRMPQTDTAFASGGLTIRTHPSGYRELLSLDARGRVYGVRVPAVWNDTIATGYALYGAPQLPAGHRSWNIGMDHAGGLLVFHAPGYPADSPEAMATITRYAITGTALTNKAGPYALPGVHFHRRHGGSLILPDGVAAKYGGRKTVVGFGGAYNIIQGGSTGTSAYAVDLNTAATTTILEFPWGDGSKNERRRGDYVNEDSGEAALRQPTGPGNFDGFWTHTDTRSGAAWGHGGLWTVGTEATGRVRYGDEAGESGFHADAFKTFVRFYPEAQLDQVRTGQLTAQQTRPAYWRLGEIPGVPAWLATQLNINGTPRVSPEPRVNGLAIDGDTLIVGGPFAWGGAWNEYPAVYAFRIGVGTTPDPDPDPVPGVPGPTGPQGPAGPIGPTGPAGRDAVPSRGDVKILPVGEPAPAGYTFVLRVGDRAVYVKD
jgi:hypothetical protein